MRWDKQTKTKKKIKKNKLKNSNVRDLIRWDKKKLSEQNGNK